MIENILNSDKKKFKMDLISTEIFESQNRGPSDGPSWLKFVQGPLVENEFDKRF